MKTNKLYYIDVFEIIVSLLLHFFPMFSRITYTIHELEFSNIFFF